MLAVMLKVLSSRQQGSVIPLPIGRFLIGREEDCHLRPNSELVSRHHCVFTHDEYTVRVRDLGSTNGTFVNGNRVRGTSVLSSGDRVSVGKLEFEIVIGEEDFPANAEDAASPVAQPLEEAPPSPADETAMIDRADTPTEVPSYSSPAPAPAADPAPAPPPAAAPGVGDTAMFPAMPAGYPQMPGYAPQMPPQQPYPYPAYPQGMYPGYYMPPNMGYPQQGAYPPQGAPPAPAQNQGEPEDDYPEISLPDPATTGAKPPEAKATGSGGGDSAENPAADIIKQYLERRPAT